MTLRAVAARPNHRLKIGAFRYCHASALWTKRFANIRTACKLCSHENECVSQLLYNSSTWALQTTRWRDSQNLKQTSKSWMKDPTNQHRRAACSMCTACSALQRPEQRDAGRQNASRLQTKFLVCCGLLHTTNQMHILLLFHCSPIRPCNERRSRPLCATNEKRLRLRSTVFVVVSTRQSTDFADRKRTRPSTVTQIYACDRHIQGSSVSRRCHFRITADSGMLNEYLDAWHCCL